MKILQINITCSKGSTGKMAVGLNNALIEKSYESIIAYGYGKSSYEFSHKIGNWINYYFHNILSRLLGHEGFYSYAATKKFLSWIDGFQPDIIHLHNLHGHFINIELLFEYIKSKQIPIVWTLHDCWAFTGKCVHFDMVQCMKWQSQCNRCPQLNKYPKSILDLAKSDYIKKKSIFSGVDNMIIVTPSKWLKELLKKSYLSKYPLQEINNGIDTSVFNPRPLRDAILKEKLKDKFVVLAVASNWDKRKGFNDVINLSKELEYKNDIITIIVGLNDKQLKMIPKNIIGIKKTENQTKLAELYSRADILINTTYEDNYPTVNLESLACGTPVATYDSGGSGEIIEDSRQGFVVEKGNREFMKKAILEIYKLSPKGKTGQPLLDEENYIQRSNEEYFKLYKKLYSSRKE